MRQLERENNELRRTNEILKSGVGFLYADEARERAVRMVFDHQAEYQSQWKAVESIAPKLSIEVEILPVQTLCLSGT